jgi:hypothetical protein
MSKKLKHAEQYLLSQQEAWTKRLDFIKSQGEFFKKVLEPLDLWRQIYSLILSEFYQMASDLKSYYENKGKPKRAPESLREWPKLSAVMSIEQRRTQEELKKDLDSLLYDYEDGQLDIELTIVNFKDGVIVVNDALNYLSHAVINVGIESSVVETFSLRFGDRLDATIYLHNMYGSPQALLKAKVADGKDYYFELKHFSILTLLDENNRIYDEEWGENLNSKDNTLPANSEHYEEGQEANTGINETPNQPHVGSKEIPRETGVFAMVDMPKRLFFNYHILIF